MNNHLGLYWANPRGGLESSRKLARRRPRSPDREMHESRPVPISEARCGEVIVVNMWFVIPMEYRASAELFLRKGDASVLNAVYC